MRVVAVVVVQTQCVAVAEESGAKGSKIMVTERGRGATKPHVNLLSSVMEGGTPAGRVQEGRGIRV